MNIIDIMGDHIHSYDKGNLSGLNDSIFSRSATSLTISSINNTTHPFYSHGRPSQLPLNNQHNRDNIKDGRKLSVECTVFEDRKVPATPVMTGSSFDNQNILSDIETSPSTTIFDQNSPLTPQTPYLSDFPTKKSYISPETEQLSGFVLSPDVFSLELDDQIGKGSNAYVYASKLSAVDQPNNSFNVAVKIPTAKNKRSYIMKEAKFAIKLREYQDVWFATETRIYPFIEIYGIYYMDKSMFSLFTSYEKYPCLIMKKMVIGLRQYIDLHIPEGNSPKLNIGLWWKLCQTLLDSLSILKHLNSVHCDLKTDNIMIYEYNPASGDILENTVFKVIDFSSASDIHEMTTTPDMTLQFTAPELLNFREKKLPNFESDMYSAGLILLEAFTGKPPYASAGYDHFYLLSVIQEGRVFDWISAEDKTLLKSYPEVEKVLDMMINQRVDADIISDCICKL